MKSTTTLQTPAAALPGILLSEEKVSPPSIFSSKRSLSTGDIFVAFEQPRASPLLSMILIMVRATLARGFDGGIPKSSEESVVWKMLDVKAKSGFYNLVVRYT